MTPENEKKSLAFELLTQGETFILVDARQPGVSVPNDYRLLANLHLKFSHRYGTALEISDWGIAQELRFNGVWTEVRVPWSAVYAVWSEKVPGKLSDSVPVRGLGWQAPPEPPLTSSPAKRGGLRLVN